MTLAPSRPETAADVVAAKLRDPQVAASLATLLDHADLLALLVEALDGFVERSEVIGDSLISGLDELRTIADANGGNPLAGIDFEAIKTLTQTLANSDLLKPEAVEALGVIARGAARGSAQYAGAPVQIGGLLSLGRLLKDPDINRAISFTMTLAKAVGQELATQQPAPAAAPKHVQ
jgi:uncharacterized protein YjgD (DUF1641 family)